MSNFVIEIKAPELVGAMEKLAAALMNKTAAERGMDGCAPVNPPAPAPAPVTASAPAPAPVMAPAPVNPPAPAPVQAPAAAPVQTSVPVAAPAAYTFEQLQAAASQIVNMPGKQAELVALLARFGVQALTLLPPEQYGAFATELRGLGAKI